MNNIKDLSHISLKTMKLFNRKIIPTTIYRLQMVWQYLMEMIIKITEKVKAASLKKALCLSKYIASCLVYALTREIFFIEDLRNQLLSTHTHTSEQLFQKRQATRNNK
jgi:hypothetical protein